MRSFFYIVFQFGLVCSLSSVAIASLSKKIEIFQGNYAISLDKKPEIDATSEAYFKNFTAYAKSQKSVYTKTEKITSYFNPSDLCPKGDVYGNEKHQEIAFGDLDGKPLLFGPIDGLTYKSNFELNPEYDATDDPATCEVTRNSSWDKVNDRLIFFKTQICEEENIIEQITTDFINPNKIQLTRYYDVYDKEESVRKPFVIYCTLERIPTKRK